MSTSSGYYIAPVHKTPIAVSGSSQQALAANEGAQYRLFTNDSANVMYLALGTAAALNNGIRLSVPGSGNNTYEMTLLNGNMYRGVVNVIGTTGNLLVTEGT